MRRLLIRVVAVAILLVLAIYAASAYSPLGRGQSSTEPSPASSTTATVMQVGGVSVILGMSPPDASSGDWLLDNPSFAGNSLKIDYPPGYGVLANYTLGLINADRASSGLGALSLSRVPSGQQHADSMAYYGYFSHWDVQGYKPYTRYTLLGGTGSVEENLALSHCSATSPNSADAVAAPCTVQTVENAINASEWEMMVNDSQCCGNGHRDNILGPFHDFVSVGVAYNSSTVFLVEDFEDSYISSESLQVSSSGLVSFSGTLPQVPYVWMTHQVGAEIAIFYDPTPSSISRGELDQISSCSQFSELNESAACQYQGAYNPGTAVSTVLEPCSPGECATGNYIYAQTWQYNSTSGDFDIVFSMAALESAHGNGVYTLYLWPSERAPEAITSLSVFVTGQ